MGRPPLTNFRPGGRGPPPPPQPSAKGNTPSRAPGETGCPQMKLTGGGRKTCPGKAPHWGPPPCFFFSPPPRPMSPSPGTSRPCPRRTLPVFPPLGRPPPHPAPPGRVCQPFGAPKIIWSKPALKLSPVRDLPQFFGAAWKPAGTPGLATGQGKKPLATGRETTRHQNHRVVGRIRPQQ